MRWLTVATLLLWAPCVWAQSQTPAQPHSPSPKPLDTKAEPWEYSLTVDGYIIEGSDGYASPTFTADHNWLHLEARYNYENFRTGSLWAGYNFSWGKTWQFAVTPMIGGVFGRTNGIAPGCEASLAYRKLTLSIDNEYVFDTTSKSGNFYYTWPQLTYAAAGLAKSRGGGAAHQVIPDARRCPARVPRGVQAQEVRIHHVRLQPRNQRHVGGSGSWSELLRRSVFSVAGAPSFPVFLKGWESGRIVVVRSHPVQPRQHLQ